MQPPVTLDTLMAEWANDSQVDATEPALELAKIGSLRAKYLKILAHHNLKTKQATSEYTKLKRVKWEYYSGDLNNPDDLKEHGWPPQMKKILRQDVPMWLDADPDLIKILMKKSYNQEIVDACTDIIKELHSRTFQLKSFIEWQKFIGNQ